MFNSIKHLWAGRSPEGTADRNTLATWARQAGHTLKAVPGQAGGVVIHSQAGWRLEWGPSQRPYFPKQELRFRSETSMSPDVQWLWLSKTVAQNLETDVFARFTDAMQTRIDHSLPEEMRWLAMHPKVTLQDYPLLARRFVFISNAPAQAGQWLESDVSAALEVAAAGWWVDQVVVLLTLNRGLLTLRLCGDDLSPNQLPAVAELFDQAVQATRSVH